jgi:hypothetical protein
MSKPGRKPTLSRRAFAGAALTPFLIPTRASAAGETVAETRRLELYGLLGDLPPRDRAVSARTVSVEQRPAYVLETLVLDLNGFEPVPAYFVKPRSLAGRAPTVLYNHAHGGDYPLGKRELLEGRKELTEDHVRAAAKKSGLVDVKVVAFSATHSALKLVIPLARR